jgi:hypothetical protein
MGDEEVFDVTPIPPPNHRRKRMIRISMAIAIIVISILTITIYFFVIKTDVSVEFVISPTAAKFNDPYSYFVYLNNHGLATIHVDSIDIIWNSTTHGRIYYSKLNSGSSGWKSSDVPGNSRGLVYQFTGPVSGTEYGHWDVIVTVNTNIGYYSCEAEYEFTIL